MRAALMLLMTVAMTACFPDEGESCEPDEVGQRTCNTSGYSVLECESRSWGGEWVLVQYCGDINGRCDDETFVCTVEEEDTPSGGTCCKHCGSNSKPCGDTCISLDKTCNTPPGYACR